MVIQNRVVRCCVEQVPLSSTDVSDSRTVRAESTTPHSSDAPFKVGVSLPRKAVAVGAALAVVFVLT